MRSTRVPGLGSRRGVVEEQGVELATGGVALPHVECFEVVPVGLDLGPLGDAEAEPDEHVLEPLPRLRDEVCVPAGRTPGVLGEVEPFGLHACGEGGIAEQPPARVDRRLGGLQRLVHGLTGGLLLLDRGEAGELCLELGEGALLAEQPGCRGRSPIRASRQRRSLRAPPLVRR